MHCNVRQQNDCIVQVLYPAAFLLHKAWTLFRTLSQLSTVFETYFLVMCVMCVCACMCSLLCTQSCVCMCVCVSVCACDRVRACILPCFVWKCLIFCMFLLLLFCLFIYHWFVHCMFFFMLSSALSLWMYSINSLLLLFKIPYYYPYLSRLLCQCTVQVERTISWFSVSKVQCNNRQHFLWSIIHRYSATQKNNFIVHWIQVQCNTKNTDTVQPNRIMVHWIQVQCN